MSGGRGASPDATTGSIRAVLLDIEGTTTDVRFVHETLFPLSRHEMAAYVTTHPSDPDVRAACAAIAAQSFSTMGSQATPNPGLLGSPSTMGSQATERDVSIDEVIRTLVAWIDADRKETSLKALQGKIWRAAYEAGTVRGHVYSDVEPALRRWTEAGLRVHVFSSGSVEAQKLLFSHSEAGDLTRFLDAHFDTTTGPKRDPASYRRIADAVRRTPAELLFLSDVTAELDAAAAAGMGTVQLLRPGTPVDPASRHPTATSFDVIFLTPERAR